jgi:serine/threonine-protein kinase/endoribonuclease IRE1
LEHAFFVDQSKRIEIITRVSNELENQKSQSLVQDLENSKNLLFVREWKDIDPRLVDLLTKERGYNFTKLRDLLRAMRNTYAHYESIPETLRNELFCTEGTVAERVIAYFIHKFPRLYLVVHQFVLKNWADKHIFQGLIKQST